MSRLSKLAGRDADHLQRHFRLCVAWPSGCLTHGAEHVEETKDCSHSHILCRPFVSPLLSIESAPQRDADPFTAGHAS